MAAAIPWIIPQWLDNNGRPLAGGKVWTYQAGTSTPVASYTDSTGLVPNTNPVILDSSGRANVWLAPGSYKIVLMDANDNELWSQDKVKPADGGGGGIVDSDYAYEGYSARFSEQFGPSSGLNDTLQKILQFTYVAPSVSLAASGSTTIREKGDPVTATTLTATITKKTDAIAAVRFYKDAGLIHTDPAPPALGGTSVYAWSGSFSDNSTFSVQVDDNGASGGPTTVNSSRTFSFVYPYYVGAGAAGLTAAAVAGLTKLVIASTANRTETITASAGNVFYFAYPASYGALTSILDENNFETLPDWTLRTEDITGLDANPVSYRIYEFNNPVTAGSYQFTFKR